MNRRVYLSANRVNVKDGDTRNYTISFIVKWDEDQKDWVTVDLTNGTEYEVRVWIEANPPAVFSNTVVVSPGVPTPTPTPTNTPVPI